MARELSEDRQQLIFRYMQDAVRSEPAEPRPRPAATAFVQVDPPPARLDLLRWWAAERMHRHPQVRLAVLLVALAVAVGWLVTRL